MSGPRDWLRSRAIDWLLPRRERIVRHVDAEAGGRHYRFACRNPVEIERATTLAHKEAGTIAWLHDSLGEGDRVVDVGANVGLYTVVAARLVGAEGRVYAFEPHLANAVSLLENLALNGLSERVRVYTLALGEREGFGPFHYFRFDAGTSQSQLDTPVDDQGRDFTAAAVERKVVRTLDGLVAAGEVERVDHVKIDVDGNELPILRGMRALLGGAARPKTVQVEVSPKRDDGIGAFMDELGWALATRHETRLGRERIAAGADPDSITHNRVYRPR